MAASKRKLLNFIIAATPFAAANEEENRKNKKTKWMKEWFKRQERGSYRSIEHSDLAGFNTCRLR